MVGVILCSKARRFERGEQGVHVLDQNSAARASCTDRQVSSTSEEVMP